MPDVSGGSGPKGGAGLAAPKASVDPERRAKALEVLRRGMRR